MIYNRAISLVHLFLINNTNCGYILLLDVNNPKSDQK